VYRNGISVVLITLAIGGDVVFFALLVL